MPTLGTSRLMRCVVSMPPGAGSDRSSRTMSGLISTAMRERVAAVLGLADDVEVRLALEDLAHAHAEQRVVVDEQDLGPLLRVAPVRTAAPAIRSRVVGFHHGQLLSSLLVYVDGQPHDGAGGGLSEWSGRSRAGRPARA